MEKWKILKIIKNQSWFFRQLIYMLKAVDIDTRKSTFKDILIYQRLSEEEPEIRHQLFQLRFSV